MDYDQLADYEDYLPETAKNILDVIGIVDTIKLVRKHGGNQLLIPKVRHCGNAINYLVDVIGEASAFKLIEHFRGDRLYLPRCDHALRKLRNDQFVQAVDDYVIEHKATQDQALFALCPQFGITYRSAFYIIKNNKVEKKLAQVVQDRLF